MLLFMMIPEELEVFLTQSQYTGMKQSFDQFTQVDSTGQAFIEREGVLKVLQAIGEGFTKTLLQVPGLQRRLLFLRYLLLH